MSSGETGRSLTANSGPKAERPSGFLEIPGIPAYTIFPLEAKDLFDKTRNSPGMRDIQTLRSLSAYPFSKVCIPAAELSSAQVQIAGRNVLMFGSNDYLALTRDLSVIEAAVEAAKRYGTGCSGSRLMNGTTALHVELEEELARFFGKEDSLLFGTGFQTNSGTIAALAGIKDVIIADEYCHASLVEGMRLSYARKARFRHNSLNSLAETLKSCKDTEGKLVLVEGVYSMGGDLAELPGIVDLCRCHKARLYLDDAHGIGVLGANGRGAAESFGLEHEIDVLNGTFSKSLASAGGFIAADSTVVEYVKHHAAPFVFSASMPPASLAAVSAALRIIRNEPERRRRLLETAAECRRMFCEEGIKVPDFGTPIIVLCAAETGDIRMTAVKIGQFSNVLLEKGIYVNGVIANAAPLPLLRISITAAHGREHAAELVDKVVEISKQLGVKLKGWDGATTV